MRVDAKADVLLTAQGHNGRGLGLYRGKRGYGISVEFSVQTGPITILGATQTVGSRRGGIPG